MAFQPPRSSVGEMTEARLRTILDSAETYLHSQLRIFSPSDVQGLLRAMCQQAYDLGKIGADALPPPAATSTFDRFEEGVKKGEANVIDFLKQHQKDLRWSADHHAEIAKNDRQSVVALGEAVLAWDLAHLPDKPSREEEDDAPPDHVDLPTEPPAPSLYEQAFALLSIFALVKVVENGPSFFQASIGSVERSGASREEALCHCMMAIERFLEADDPKRTRIMEAYRLFHPHYVPDMPLPEVSLIPGKDR